jgi:hypothetical protein
MKELITRPQADLLFLAVAALGVVAGLVAAALAPRWGVSRLRLGVAAGGPLVLLGGMWRVYNAVTDRLGLDTVMNLGVNAALFVAVGIVCGVVWSVTGRGERS